MLRTHMITAIGMIALTGCTLLGKGSARLGGSSPPAVPTSGSSPAADVPQVAADAQDSQTVRLALDKLTEIEKLLEAKDWVTYARASTGFQIRSLVQQDWAKEPKGPAIQQRIDGLDAAAYKTFGGRLLATVGDGKRIRDGVNPDAVEAASEMLDVCEAATKTRWTEPAEGAARMKVAIAAYEKAIARVKKLDPKALRYLGSFGTRRGSGDVPNELLACETVLARSQRELTESYQPEVAAGDAAVEIGCGVVEWLADGIQVGANQFAPYRRTAGGNSFVEKVPCTKVPKKDKYPPAFAAAVKELRAHLTNKHLVIVLDGAPYVEVSEEDYRAHRYQKLRAYSKTFELASNPCGELGVFCEAGGSKGAGAYNRLEFALERAAVHAGTNPTLCKAHLKDAKAHATWFAELHAELVKKREWIAGSTYRTKQGVKLKEKDFLAAFATKGKLAEDRYDDGYCAKPAR